MKPCRLVGLFYFNHPFLSFWLFPSDANLIACLAQGLQTSEISAEIGAGETDRWVMVSRIFKGAATAVAALSFASAASAGCGSSTYCGSNTSSTLPSLSSWNGSSTGASYSYNGTSSRYSPSTSYTSTMSSYATDATYGTGSISETYTSSDTYAFSGSTTSIPGLGANESLQMTSCPTNVYGTGEGRVLGCYNVVKAVPQTTYYRVVRPIIYVRYPVPVAVPYTSPCHTVTHYSRYGDWHTGGYRAGCG